MILFPCFVSSCWDLVFVKWSFCSIVFFALTSSVSLIGFYTEDEAVSIETYSIKRAIVLVSAFFICLSWGSDGSQRVLRVFNFISLFLTNAAKHDV